MRERGSRLARDRELREVQNGCGGRWERSLYTEVAGGLGSSMLSFQSLLRAPNWEGHSHFSCFWGALQLAGCFHDHLSSALVSVMMNDRAKIVNMGED